MTINSFIWQCRSGWGKGQLPLSIRNIELKDFRGYSHLKLEDLGPLVMLVGQNAVGKTNIIEGVQLLTAGESFRKPKWGELVSWDAASSFAFAEMVDADAGRFVQHKMKIAGGKREYEVNGKAKQVAQVRGTCPSVVFIPDHLQMIKASSSIRRDAIDALGVQLSKNYGALKNDYAKTLKQRNLLLKNEVGKGPLFDSWDESLAVNGARLCVNRVRLFKRLADYMKSIYAQLVPTESLEGVYVPSWARFDESMRQVPPSANFNEQTQKAITDGFDIEDVEEEIRFWSPRLREQELSRKISLIGPHKDEIAFYINGRNARQFASQGQQRTVVLAWKLAEVEMVREFTGGDPILLLDDVMSELDEQRRDALTEFIEGNTQTFVTTANLGYFSNELLKQAQIIELPIEGTKNVYR